MGLGQSGDRTRHVVLLVVATIALPSVLLTGLGVAAIENEEAASRRRLEHAYVPVLGAMAKRFNERIDRLLVDSYGALTELAEFRRGDEDRQIDDFRAFAKDAPFALNYFVIDEGSDVLMPEIEPPCGETWAEVVTRHSADCGPDATCDCAVYEAIANADYRDEPIRCAARYAVALCLAERTHSSPGVPECLDDGNVIGATLSLAATRPRQGADPEAWSAEALTIAERLGSPDTELSTTAAEVIGWWFKPRLETIKTPEAEAAQCMVRLIGNRTPLIRLLAELNRPSDGKPMVSSWSVDNLRRVVVTLSIDDMLVGFELSPARTQLYVNEGIKDLELDAPVSVRIHPIESPKEDKEAYKEEYDNRATSWALLKRTQLAWEMIIMLDDDGDLFDLVRSRSAIYMWALGLTVLALLGGIGFTVRAVLREARESRLKTDFVSSVSHDLRTPLTSIRMFTESLLMGRVESGEEITESLQVIALETERLTRLTERILDFSRMEAGRKAYTFEPTSIGPIIEHALTACGPMIEAASFTVRRNLEATLPMVNADSDALIEALINLVSNAIKYSPGGSEICVEAKAEDGVVCISVIDFGMGIPKSEHKRIFEKFYRVDCRRTSEVSGCGLGLSLVEHIVDAHCGELRLQSMRDRGSTFTIRLQAAAGLSAAMNHTEGQSWKLSSS